MASGWIQLAFRALPESFRGTTRSPHAVQGGSKINRSKNLLRVEGDSFRNEVGGTDLGALASL